MIRCPYCMGETGIKESRLREGNIVYRKRVCVHCGRPTETYELAKQQYIRVKHTRKLVGMLKEFLQKYEIWLQTDNEPNNSL